MPFISFSNTHNSETTPRSKSGARGPGFCALHHVDRVPRPKLPLRPLLGLSSKFYTLILLSFLRILPNDTTVDIDSTTMPHRGTIAARAEGQLNSVVHVTLFDHSKVDNSSVAHRCLSIPEVLEEVTAYLATDRSEKSLAYLARTWKRFHEVAQNALWRNACLECVLECFPRTSWEMDKSTVVSHCTLA